MFKRFKVKLTEIKKWISKSTLQNWMKYLQKWGEKMTSVQNDILKRGIKNIAQSKHLWEENQSFSYEDFEFKEFCFWRLVDESQGDIYGRTFQN